MPRPLEDFLKCSRAEERRVRRVAWRLKEAVKQSRRPSIEDYVKALAARVNLPAPVVKRALDILERKGVFWLAKTRGFLRSPPYGWRR